MFEQIYNLLVNESNKVKGTCRICNRPIFNLNTAWGMRGFCVYCGEAYGVGKKAGVEKISDNDYGYVWYMSREELNKALTIDMLKKGYNSIYDKWLNAYRIVKPEKIEKKPFWAVH